MKLFRRAGLSLSLLLVPALVLNPTPASARVLDPGSPVTSWGNNGAIELWETGATNDLSISNQDVYEDNSGRYVFAALDTGLSVFTETISVRAISANGSQAFNYALPETTYDYVNLKNFDIDGAGKYVVAAYILRNNNYEVAITRLNSNGSVDTSFAAQGVFNFQTRIDSYLSSLQSGCTGLINLLDIASDPLDSSVYILGSVTPNNCTIAGFSSTQTRLWKLDSSGNIDTVFGTSTLEAFPVTGDSSISPFSSRTGIIKTNDGLTLDLMMTGQSQVNVSHFELFHQEIDISGNVPSAVLQANQKSYNSSNRQSNLILRDFEIRNDGKFAILASESVGNTSYNNYMLLDSSTNEWANIDSETDCTYESVGIDAQNNTYVSKECGIAAQSYTDVISKYSSLGAKQVNFVGPQGNFGSRSEIDYWRNKLFVDSVHLTVIGTAAQRSGQPRNTFVFGNRYHLNSITIPDPPAPAAAPVPAPAAVVAPALPTQSAPVSVPATVKAKKKLSFPLTSRAGNALSVSATGSCKVSPVFKKVKVKVGKKTKRVKQQTGWTVQMNKKKQTCTITQTDAGGNGYAALSSTSTVTIK